MSRQKIATVALAAAFFSPWIVPGSAQQTARPMGVDELMRMRSIVDVQIAPDGGRVAYVVSTPNLEKNEHDAAVFVVPSTGGTPERLAESIRVFNVPSPRPQLRWSPDGRSVSVLAFAAGRPEVFAVPVAGGEPPQVTKAPEGVIAYEWSPDGKSLGFITVDSMSAEEERRRADKSFIIRAGAADRATRLVVQRVDQPGALRIVTPPTQYV